MIEAISFDRANSLQRMVRRFAANGPGSWLFARVSATSTARSTGSRTAATRWPPCSQATPTQTGPVARHPVRFLGGDHRLDFGQEHHPAWYHNLRAHADAELEVNGVRQRVRAVKVQGERRAQIWRQGLSIYPGFSQYELRASHRNISVFILQPR